MMNLFPLELATPIADTLTEPRNPFRLPQRIRSWACLEGRACSDLLCACTCHDQPATAFAAFVTAEPERSAMDDVARDLSGERMPFRLEYFGEDRPADLEDFLSTRFGRSAA